LFLSILWLALARTQEKRELSPTQLHFFFSLAITHQHAISILPHLQNALEHNIKIRIILPSGLDQPPGYFEHEFVKGFLKINKSAVQSGLYEERQLPKTDICLTVADRN
jgi:hypothetical protein